MRLFLTVALLLMLVACPMAGCALPNNSESSAAEESTAPEYTLSYPVMFVDESSDWHREYVPNAELYAHMHESLSSATSEYEFPLRTESQIVSFALCIQEVVSEYDYIPEEWSPAMVFRYNDCVLEICYAPNGEIIYDGDGCSVYVSEENGAILHIHQYKES